MAKNSKNKRALVLISSLIKKSTIGMKIPIVDFFIVGLEIATGLESIKINVFRIKKNGMKIALIV